MELPLLEMSVDDIGENGIKCISFVERPAIQVGWIAFKEEDVNFAIESEEERIVFGPVLIPGQKVYRKFKEIGECYVTASAESIRSIRDKFFKEKLTDIVSEEHGKQNKVDAYLVQSFISDSNRGINNPKPFEHLPDKTLFMGYKVVSDALWGDVKSGKFLAFSMEGSFKLEPKSQDTEMQRLIAEMSEFIDSKLNSLK